VVEAQSDRRMAPGIVGRQRTIAGDSLEKSVARLGLVMVE
jgi:hypothetical protein